MQGIPGPSAATRPPFFCIFTTMQDEITVKTSEDGWLARLADAYRERRSITLIDDAKVGIDPSGQSLLEMGRHAKLSPRDWAGVMVSLGMSGFGVAMVIAAVFDPDPTSKLGLLVGGGTVCILGGGFSAVRILTRLRPPTLEVHGSGFRLRWG